MEDKALRNLFWAVSVFGTPFFLVPAIIYLFKANQILALDLIYVLIITQIICTIIKYLYPKARPMPMPNKTLIQKYMAGSFPSIHTARITAFSIPIIKFYPRSMILFILILLIISVGYSRIYLKKHYFVDVLAGFLIGAITTILWLGIQNYLNLY